MQNVGGSVGEKNAACEGVGADFLTPAQRTKMAAVPKVCRKLERRPIVFLFVVGGGN